MLLPKRIWKDIEGYEGLYQVSDNGKVRSLPYNGTEKVQRLKLQPIGKGYLFVKLSKNKKTKIFLVHRLVATAFIPNPNNLPEINHKDENKTNNHVNNLEWCDRKYNCNYGTRNERISKSRKRKCAGKNSPSYRHEEIMERKKRKSQYLEKINDQLKYILNHLDDFKI